MYNQGLPSLDPGADRSDATVANRLASERTSCVLAAGAGIETGLLDDCGSRTVRGGSLPPLD